MSSERPSSEHQDDEVKSEADDDSTEGFADILAAIHTEHIPSFCFTVRKRSGERNGIPHASSVLPIVEEPLFGSYHALFPVQFHDGPKWLLKVPAQGTHADLDESASKSLTSEAATMIFLRLNTTMPIPEVFAYDASLDNEIGCPFILMEFVKGVSLYDCWFDKAQDNRNERRTQALKDVAAAMAQLDRFSFDHGGSLVFDDNGDPKSIGPLRCIDHKAALDRIFTGDGVEKSCYFDAGPFSEVCPFYTRFLDQQTEPTDPMQKGLLRLLRFLLELVPCPQDFRKKFVLAHPDFDIQNFIVSQDGYLQAIIDWDAVATVPRSVGYESYPGWLTRDWDPAMYGWTEDMEQGIEPNGLWEDSPSTLARHRTDYELFMRSALSQEPKTAVPPEADANDVQSTTSRTANSLYVENLLNASSNPLCMFLILNKFIGEINRVCDSDLDVFEIARAFADEELKEDQIDVIKKGFQAIFQSSPR